MGGLPKKSYQIKTIANKEKHNALVLDAGNLLFKPQSPLQMQEKIVASGIMEIYKAMSYDAVAVGPHDVAAGLDFLVESQKNGFPWLSANILNEEKKPIFKPSIIVKRAGLNVGIIGLSDPATPMAEKTTVADWRYILPGQLLTMKKDCDLLILLSTLPDQDNAEIIRDHPLVHIVVTASRQRGNVVPRVVNNTLITQTYSQGKYLGVLTVDWNPGQSWLKNLDQEDLILHDRLNVIERQILKREKLKTQSATLPTDKLQQLKKERDEIYKKISLLKEQITEFESNKGSYNTFEHSFIALNKELPEDPEIAERVSRIKETISNGNQETFTRGSQSIILPEDNNTRKLAGFSTCSTCHPAQTKFWKTTKHAIAYQTLVRNKQNYNLDCLPCHVTTSTTDEKRPEMDIANLPLSLQAVGCESCHGLGQAHANNPDHVLPQRTVAKKNCLQCHTKDRSPDFDFEKYISRVSCPVTE